MVGRHEYGQDEIGDGILFFFSDGYSENARLLLLLMDEILGHDSGTKDR
jgi:hypothetical protein